MTLGLLFFYRIWTEFQKLLDLQFLCFDPYFSSQKILPILTIEDLVSCNYIQDIFLENGIKIFEITLRTNVALEAINFLAQNKNFIVGAGTLTNEKNVQSAVDVGAKFGVSPGISDELFQHAKKIIFL